MAYFIMCGLNNIPIIIFQSKLTRYTPCRFVSIMKEIAITSEEGLMNLQMKPIATKSENWDSLPYFRKAQHDFHQWYGKCPTGIKPRVMC